ncbi:uncharacterized protein LOC131030145 [Cryptomeria japonica]|uniref:uncharacterized protein LOC131030145 n=1 Tax=Cryptomeria japonica TaxID=3369 RepID=UPI0027DA4439|nr:uncharacterized protein LOC131030145 [Cryptomeria japonica]XP_059066938.1 uncharacterized protein LOC131030145 [Cryptomeria japonica]
MVASQPNERMSSDNGQKFDVFLSHSGKQKNFVRQLYRDLKNQGVSCFFDQDRQSLPLGEDFPPLIFEAAKTCRLAVFLLSKEFLQSKWPMLELSTVVEARDANRHPEILPLFFMISPEALKQITTLNERWKEIGIDYQRRVKWPQDLKAIGRVNGLKFGEGGNEVEFRAEIVKEIWRKLPTASPRYHVPYMQGELRMCQEVADFLRDVRPNEKGIIIAGLYGIAGQGKTTLGKAFCNHKLKDFEGKVCHLEFSRGDSFERTKLALQYLIHCHPSYLQDLTKDQAQVELHRRINGQRVLLVLDNITEESIDEVRYFVKAVFRENSCILLSARSLDVLVKHCKIDPQSCMRVPSLDEDDAIAVLLERTSPEESTLGAEDRTFALKCANRCSFKEISCDIGRRGRKFHPLALKAFGGHLFSKYGSTLSKWVAEIDGMVEPSGYGLDGVLSVLDKAFDDMGPKYRTIFMLLTIYIPLNMSLHNVFEWLAMSCNEEIEFIVEAVNDLCRKAFIEESEPEIRIHDLYFEFAQSKAKEMGRWLCWKGDEHSTRGFIPHGNAGFELVKLEGCLRRSPSEIASKFLENVLVLQLVGVQNMNKLDLGQMEGLRSITLQDCKVLSALDGMEYLRNLAWLQISGLGKMLKLSKLSSLIGLQHLEIDITSQRLNQLGDLTPCFRLREINVRCPSLLEFPRLNGLPYLEKVEFDMCDKVKGPLDCTDCLELQSIVLVGCCEMTASPLLAGCQKLSTIVLSECNAVRQCRDMNLPSALKTLELQTSSWNESAPKRLESCYRLESLQLWNMWNVKELPSFRSLSNLTVLKIGKCGISEPPDLTCCVLLEDVYFFTLKCLLRFPNFSLLKKLKKLSLYNCSKVRDPPDFSGCHQLRLFYLLYNDSLKGLSKMDKCAQLEEIKVSWHCKDEVLYEGIDPDSCQIDDDLEFCLDCFKEVTLENLNGVSFPEELEEWMQGKTMLVKKYFRGVKLYYSVTAPYEWDKKSKRYSQNPITLRLVDSRVLAYSTLYRGNEDDGWLDRVRVYFGGQDIARSSAASGMKVETSVSLTSSPMYRVKMWKTKLAKVFFDNNLGKFELENFDRKICHLDSFGGDRLARQKLALRHLTQFRSMQVEWVTEEYKALYFFNRAVEGRWVLLVLDNITENSIDQVRYYHVVEGSCTLFTEGSADVRKSSNINSQSFKRLQEEEFLAILIQRTSDSYTAFNLRCAKKCSFKEGKGFIPRFHRLALKAFGQHSSDLSKWLARLDILHSGSEHLDALFNAICDVPQPQLFVWVYHVEKWFAKRDCVDDVFAGLCWLAIMCEKGREISPFNTKLPKFKKEIKHIKENMSFDRDFEGLALKCKTTIKEMVEENKPNSGILYEIIKENYDVSGKILIPILYVLCEKNNYVEFF